MKRLLKAAAALVCAFGFTFAHAQQTTITASSINMGGVPIAAGVVTFTPVNTTGVPIAFATGGGGLNSPTAFSCTITSGAITGSCQIPDSALTTPANILYSIQITNTGSQKSFTLQQVANITGATWALDQYGPPATTTNVQPVQIAYGTAAPPASCISPSLYVRNYGGGQLFVCVGGTFVQISGAGNATASTIGTFLGFGDSTMAGSFASLPQNSMFAALAADYPGNAVNYGLPGAVMAQITVQGFNYYLKPLTTTRLPVILTNGGINDANTIGSTTGAINNYKLELAALIYWYQPASYTTMASSATASGFSATYTGATVSNSGIGTAKQSITVGDTLTFTGTAIGSKIGLTYSQFTSGTGTFTVGLSINGGSSVLQTDICSGTTTFSAFGCNSQAVTATTMARQEFSVTPGAAYTLVVTVTGTTGATNTVAIQGIDLTPTSSVGLPPIIMSGLPYQDLDAKSATTAAFNTAATSVLAQAVSDKLNVTYVDLRTGSPGVNSTTDMAASTTACPALSGNTPLHPNDCGYLDWAQTIENAVPNIFSAAKRNKPQTYFGPLSSYIVAGSSTLAPIAWQSNVNSIIPSSGLWAPPFCTFSTTFCTGINWSTTQGTYTNAIWSPTTAAVQHCSGSTPSGCTDSAWWDALGNQHALLGYIGPAAAPTGSCPTNGMWEFTQDGHASVCLSGTWSQKF